MLFIIFNSTIIMSQSVFFPECPPISKQKCVENPLHRVPPPSTRADIGLKTLLVLPPVKVLARSWGGGGLAPRYIYTQTALLRKFDHTVFSCLCVCRLISKYYVSIVFIYIFNLHFYHSIGVVLFLQFVSILSQ